MKRIMFLSDVSINSVGGAQESMKIIINGLDKDFDFFLITPQSKKLYKSQIVLNDYQDFILKGKSTLEKFKLLNDIRKIIVDLKPNIIHVQMPSTMILVGLLSSFNLIPKNVKIYFTDRGVLNKYGKLTQRLIKLFCNKFNSIITTTKYNSSLYTNMGYLNDDSKLQVISNTAGEIFDRYEYSNRNEIRSKYLIEGNQMVIGFAGRMSFVKNWPLAIDIVKELDKIYDFKVAIALGTDNTEESKNEAIGLIDSLVEVIGEDRLIYFVDLPILEMEKFYYMNDIFILTSRQESFGRTAIEAMSRKNVVYGTRVDGLEEVLNYEENKYSDIQELIGKIGKDFESINNLKFNKQKFYEYYHSNYNTDAYLEKHKLLYSK